MLVWLIWLVCIYPCEPSNNRWQFAACTAPMCIRVAASCSQRDQVIATESHSSLPQCVTFHMHLMNDPIEMYQCHTSFQLIRRWTRRRDNHWFATSHARARKVVCSTFHRLRTMCINQNVDSGVARQKPDIAIKYQWNWNPSRGKRRKHRHQAKPTGPTLTHGICLRALPCLCVCVCLCGKKVFFPFTVVVVQSDDPMAYTFTLLRLFIVN